MDTVHPVIAASLAAFAPPPARRHPEHIHGATGPADFLPAADMRAASERRTDEEASKLAAAIHAVPAGAMTPGLVAAVAQALRTQCAHLLDRDAREAAQGYLTDLADDMLWLAAQEDGGDA